MRLYFQDDNRKDVRQDKRLRTEGSSRGFSPRCEFEWECWEQDSDGDVLQKQMCREPQGCGQTLGSDVHMLDPIHTCVFLFPRQAPAFTTGEVVRDMFVVS